MLPIVLIGISIVGGIGIIVLALLKQPAGAGADQPVGTPTATKPTAADKSKEQLRERLVHAGLYRNNSPSFFYMTQLFFASLPLLLGILAYNVGLIRFNVAILLGLIFAISGVIMPGLWLDYRKSKRQTNIRRSIPDALDIITICVEAGLSLSAAMVRVSKDLAATHPLLATELTIVHRHVQMGKTPGEALRSFAERFDLSELRSLSSVVIQSEKFGASIATALRAHGQALRKKRMQKAHEKAQKAAIWILLPTVFCIFPALFVVILGPAAYDIAELIRTTG
ncbi:MAG: type II secretion system F family protein [Pirellulaceae bacterium]